MAAAGLEVCPQVLDVADDNSVRQLALVLEQEFGRLDVLVNNAAAYVNWMETASTTDLPAAREVLETNLFGPWRVTQLFLPLLRRSAHGRIAWRDAI